jgi:hypothetical protein
MPPQTTKPNKTGQSMQNLNKISKVAEMTGTSDGTLSDSAVTNAPPETTNKKRRPSMAKALVILGLSKKSNSTNNVSIKRFGFARSEEIGMTPELKNRNINRDRDPSSSAEQSESEGQPPKAR